MLRICPGSNYKKKEGATRDETGPSGHGNIVLLAGCAEQTNKSSFEEEQRVWLVRRRNVKFNPVGRVGLFRACGIQIGDLVPVGRMLVEDPERLAGDSVTLR